MLSKGADVGFWWAEEVLNEFAKWSRLEAVEFRAYLGKILYTKKADQSSVR